MPNNVFDPNFIQSLKDEIAKQLATSEKVTRTTVLSALGYDSNTDLELSVSLAFRLGLVPEYRMFQKVGIKPVGFVPKRQQAKATSKPRKRKAAKKTDEPQAAPTDEPTETESADTPDELAYERLANHLINGPRRQ